MSSFQKYARFHLLVTLATLLAALALYLIPATSTAYMAGFSLLSIMGFGEFYYQRPGNKPIADERDEQINRTSVLLAFTIFWICFVGWGVLITMVFSKEGVVPLNYVAPVVWLAWCLVVLIRSSTVLVLSRQET